MYVTYNISYLMLSKEKTIKLILRMKVICQLLVLMNFVFQELKILLQPMNLELRKGKKKKGAPMKVYFIFIVLTV